MLSRAAIALMPKVVREAIWGLGEDYDEKVRKLANLEEVAAIAHKAERRFPDLVGHPLGSAAIKIKSSMIILCCAVRAFSDARQLVDMLLAEGLASDLKPIDDKYDMSRSFWFGFKNGDHYALMLTLIADKAKGAECVAIPVEYGSIPTTKYELVCDEAEAESRLAPDPLMRL